MKQQIKIFTRSTCSSKELEAEVNEFLNKPIEIVNVQNEVHAGNSFSKYVRPSIITIITYKGEL